MSSFYQNKLGILTSKSLFIIDYTKIDLYRKLFSSELLTKVQNSDSLE